MRLGMFDDPEKNPYNHLSPEIVGCEKHKELALEAARQSIVLLKNQKNTLPLNAKKIKSIVSMLLTANLVITAEPRSMLRYPYWMVSAIG